MHELDLTAEIAQFDLTAEISRQLSVCNACRYCEGYCAVFPAAEMMTQFRDGDVTYLANLCHDCRNCYDACMFSPPHEFAINIPKVLAETRSQTYERYGRPVALAKALRGTWLTPVLRGDVLAFIMIGLLIFVAVALAQGPANLVTLHVGPGAFYAIVPFLALLVPALAISLWGVLVILAGARAFARDVGLPRGRELWNALGKATADALNLTYLKGGGAGCYYPKKRGSSARRYLHACVFWGFLAAFISTTIAAFEQDILHLLPPFPIFSLPVLFGIVGGVLLTIGCTGMLFLKTQADPVPTATSMTALDYAFLVVLDLVAITGLLTLVLRGTNVMGIAFTVHLAVLAGLYVTAPYGKFVHFVYRYLALVKNAAEAPTP
jgi:citrate/tricarballylate utilization protein